MTTATRRIDLEWGDLMTIYGWSNYAKFNEPGGWAEEDEAARTKVVAALTTIPADGGWGGNITAEIDGLFEMFIEPHLGLWKDEVFWHEVPFEVDDDPPVFILYCTWTTASIYAPTCKDVHEFERAVIRAFGLDVTIDDAWEVTT